MHKKVIKAAAFAAFLLSILLIAAGCGSPSLLRKEPPPPANSTAPIASKIPVKGSLTLVIENNKAILNCETDVMDGALFKLSITTVTGKELSKNILTKGGDNLKAEFDLTGIEEKTLYGFARCAPETDGTKQPEAVLKEYGSKFEYLQSDSLLWTQDFNVLVFSSGEKAR